MPEAARVVARRADLARVVADWPAAGGSVSWALCFVNSVPTGNDIRAVREAAKICDRVAAVRLAVDKVVAPRMDAVLGEAGADVAWMPRAPEGDVRVEGLPLRVEEATVLMQAMLAVLPNVVVLPRSEPLWRKAVDVWQRAAGDLAGVRVVD